MSMKGLTLLNIAEAVNGKLHNGEQFKSEIKGIAIDSRKVEEDFLFVAIKGERVDGHNFLTDVYEKGAVCSLVENEPVNITKPYIVVESTLQAIKDLAKYYRESLNIKVVGITGSVGKTSTKEFIASVLSTKYNVQKTQGNFNNEIGLPLTIFSITSEHEVAVLEMGISDFGEMHRLSKMARPDICVITNIGLCHLENLHTRDGILKAKTEMFDFANAGYNTVLNGDDDKLITVIPKGENDIIFYGLNNKNDIYAKSVENLGIEGSKAVIKAGKDEISVKINIPGVHMVSNAMAAIAVGKLLDLDVNQLKSGIENLESVGGRLNIIKSNGLTIIDDCYNANPVSTKSSLDVLEFGTGRKVAILGDMFELGENEVKLHYDLGQYLANKGIDAAVCIGTLSKNTYEGIKSLGFKGKMYYFTNVEDFFDNNESILIEGDTVLVKASHSMHFEQIVERISN